MRRVCGWLGVLVLVGCGHGGGSTGATVDAATPPVDAPPDAAARCTMTLTGALSGAEDCSAGVAIHALEPLPPAKFIVRLLSQPAGSIEIDQFDTFQLEPPSSPLSDQDTKDSLAWMGSISDGVNTWTMSGDNNAPVSANLGSFLLSYDPGSPDPSRYFPDVHGTLDATLVSTTAGTVTVHVAFSQSN